MKFKEKIMAHQDGKYDFTNELIELTLSDMTNTEMVSYFVKRDFYNEEDGHYSLTFKRWRPKYTVKEDMPEYRLAKNFKVMIARHEKRANRARSKYLFEGSQIQINENDGLDKIYTMLTSLNHHYYKDDFDKIPQSVFDEIEMAYGYEEYLTFMDELKEFINILPYINRKKQKLREEILPLIIDSLNNIIPKVDINHSENEIIGFIAVSVRNSTYRKLSKLLDTKTYNRNGETYYVMKKDMQFNQSNSQIDGLLQVNGEKLNQNQILFYNKLKELVKSELELRNPNGFIFCKDGFPIEINKRYFANKMEVNESTFKKMLDRIRNRSDKQFF